MLITILIRYIQSKSFDILSNLKPMKRFKKTFCDRNVLNFHLFIWCGNWALTSLRARMVHKTELKFDPYSYVSYESQLGSKTEMWPRNVGNLSNLEPGYTKKNKFNWRLIKMFKFGIKRSGKC